jgi:hypothetical protein
MANTLPAPRQSVTVECEVTDSRIRFEYTGTADELLAAGAIEPGMTDPGKGGVSRRDSFGEPFRRKKHKDGRYSILRNVSDTERARQMPGAPEDLSTELLRELHAQPGEVIEEKDHGRSVRIYAGTRDALIAKGVVTAEDFAGAKFEAPFYQQFFREGPIRWLTRLRDGFYRVERDDRAGRMSPGRIESLMKWIRGCEEAEKKAAFLAGATGRPPCPRDRCIGRYQRPVRWTAVGDVLLVDWRALAIDRLRQMA